MATTWERVQSVWASRNLLALDREVEQLAAEGHSRQALEEVLHALLRQLRDAGDDDDTEEIVNGVVDRLTGSCHASRQIATRSRVDEPTGVIGTPTASPQSLPTVGR